LATGWILQFDHVRGYGFVGADDGGEDVFLHASVFDGDPDELAPGTKMEFKVMAGDRGRKAFAAHLIDNEPDLSPPPPPLRPVAPPRPVSFSGPAPAPSFSGPAPAPSPSPTGTASVPHAPDQDQAPDDEQECDVLSPAEFGQELTELLLSNARSLTGRQVLEVRLSVLECARKHGWVDT
jgi:cold shock protein